MKLRFALVAGLITLGLLGGCASVPMASAEADASAKEFTSLSDKAKLYNYRNESLGSAVKLPVLIDNAWVGDTAAKTYIVRTLDPGVHTVLSKAEQDSVLQINAQSGQSYFVWQEIKMGLFAPRTLLHAVDEAVGRKGVTECKLIK